MWWIRIKSSRLGEGRTIQKSLIKALDQISVHSVILWPKIANFNVQDLERLDAIARPLADQIAESEKAIDLNVPRRLSGKSSAPPTRRVTLPDRDPVQTDIDRFHPELIMLEPHEQQDQPEKP